MTRTRTSEAVSAPIIGEMASQTYLCMIGSTTVQPYNDPSLEPTELGGSVFVPPNKLIWRATEEYGFERFPFENSDDVMGVWDGSQFVVTVRI